MHRYGGLDTYGLTRNPAMPLALALRLRLDVPVLAEG